MKRSILPYLTLSLLLLGACGGGDQKAADSAAPNQAMKASASGKMMNHDHDHEMTEVAHKAHAMVKLPTIQCDICKGAIEGGLIKTAGILSVMVDLEGKMGHVNYDGDVLSLADVPWTTWARWILPLQAVLFLLGYWLFDRLRDSFADEV